MIDAEVGAERPACRRRSARSWLRGDALSLGEYGQTTSEQTPCLCHPFIAPRALEPAYSVARPLVVALRHLVEHPGADPGRVGIDLAGPQQVVRHGGQAKARAGPFLSLVEDRHLQVPIGRERTPDGDLDQGGDVHPIAEVHGIGACVESALGSLLASSGHRTRAPSQEDGAIGTNVRRGADGREGCGWLVGQNYYHRRQNICQKKPLVVFYDHICHFHLRPRSLVFGSRPNE